MDFSEEEKGVRKIIFPGNGISRDVGNVCRNIWNECNSRIIKLKKFQQIVRLLANIIYWSFGNLYSFQMAYHFERDP